MWVYFALKAEYVKKAIEIAETMSAYFTFVFTVEDTNDIEAHSNIIPLDNYDFPDDIIRKTLGHTKVTKNPRARP